MLKVARHAAIKPQALHRPKTELIKREMTASIRSAATPLIEIQNRLANKLGGGGKTHLAGIDDDVVEQRVVDVGVEVFFQIAGAAEVFRKTEFMRFGQGHAVVLVSVFDALLERGH